MACHEGLHDQIVATVGILTASSGLSCGMPRFVDGGSWGRCRNVAHAACTSEPGILWMKCLG